MSTTNVDHTSSNLNHGAVSTVDSDLREQGVAVHLFRKCLRFHDNPPLLEAVALCKYVRCVYILDPAAICCDTKAEMNKWR